MKNNLLLLKILKYGDTLEKKLLKNHIIAIVILISMVIGSYSIITHIINTQRDGAKLINISGKQRMFIQKILTLSYQSPSKNTFKEIQTSFQLLETNNKFLINKLDDHNSLSYQDPYIKNLFYQKNGILDTLVKYKNNVSSKYNIEKIHTELFLLYDQITSYYEEKLTKRVDDLLFYEAIVLIISIITIILEGAYIFRPTIMEVYDKHKKLKNLNEQLNDKVKEQVTALVKQEQILIQQTKMAEMGEMLSDISHQWKQPLTILSMQLETIQLDMKEDTLCQDQMNLDFEECFKVIKHMHQTIEDFKNFYKPNQKKQLFDIVNAIEEIKKMEKTTLNRYTINFDISSSDQKILLDGFESQLKQVILSIVNNAIEQIVLNIQAEEQAYNKGSIKVDIKKENRKIILKISDNAGGIKEEILDKVFNPYFSTKFDNGGTGIGLYMAKLIIERNFQGSIQVINIDQGATFLIILPTTTTSYKDKEDEEVFQTVQENQYRAS